MSDHKGNLYHHHPYSGDYAQNHYTHRPSGHSTSMSPHMLPPDYSTPSHQYTLPNIAAHHPESYGYLGQPSSMSVPPHTMNQLPPPGPLITNHPRKRRYSDESFGTNATTTLPSVFSATSTTSYSDAETVHSFMQGHMPEQSPLSSSMPPPMSASMGVPLTPSISAPTTSNPPIVKKSRVNTPWTPAEEHRLKLMRDNGDSWAIIAKSFPNRTEGSVKKHWYKDMHYAEFAEDESQALLSAIREYEASKWKVIGAKVGKPAKACEQYAKDHFTKEQLAPKG